MSIMVHQVHRRMVKLHEAFKANNGLTPAQSSELLICLQINTELIQQIDGLKEAAYAAECVGNNDLLQHFCLKLDELEATLA